MTRSRIHFKPSMVIEEPTINLTPLIDVVFVILIMFIVIAPLLELDHVELADSSRAPLDTTRSVQESGPITIHVHQDNTILLNNQPISFIDLADRLKKVKMQYPQATPQVFHDKRAQFGTYQLVKNAAEEAGFSQIDVILKPA